MTEEAFQKMMDQKLAQLRIQPGMTIDQVGQLLQMFSTSICEVRAVIETVNGRPVCYFARTIREDSIPQYLKRTG